MPEHFLHFLNERYAAACSLLDFLWICAVCAVKNDAAEPQSANSMMLLI